MIRKTILWTLVILWMATIFFFSSQEAPESKKVSSGVIKTVVKTIDVKDSLTEKEVESISENLTFIVRKGAHFSAYTLLCILVALLLKEYKIIGGRQAFYSVGIAFLYACSDEFHQLFVNGRSGELRDVLIDTAGALFGVVLLLGITAIKNRKKENA